MLYTAICLYYGFSRRPTQRYIILCVYKIILTLPQVVPTYPGQRLFEAQPTKAFLHYAVSRYSKLALKPSKLWLSPMGAPDLEYLPALPNLLPLDPDSNRIWL